MRENSRRREKEGDRKPGCRMPAGRVKGEASPG